MSMPSPLPPPRKEPTPDRIPYLDDRWVGNTHAELRALVKRQEGYKRWITHTNYYPLHRWQLRIAFFWFDIVAEAIAIIKSEAARVAAEKAAAKAAVKAAKAKAVAAKAVAKAEARAAAKEKLMPEPKPKPELVAAPPPPSNNLVQQALAIVESAFAEHTAALELGVETHKKLEIALSALRSI
jgi:hypothetical protein